MSHYTLSLFPWSSVTVRRSALSAANMSFGMPIHRDIVAHTFYT